MKRLILIFAMILAAFAVKAQNVAYINTETILSSIKSYVDAQAELNALAEKYQKAIQDEVDELDAVYREYQQNRYSYSQQQQVQRENYIINWEKAINEKQETYFGENGVMAVKTEALLSPIQKKVQAAIDTVAQKYSCSLVFDTAVMAGVVYKNSKYDLTNEIIEFLK